jgi:hypothetical protein
MCVIYSDKSTYIIIYYSKWCIFILNAVLLNFNKKVVFIVLIFIPF